MLGEKGEWKGREREEGGGERGEGEGKREDEGQRNTQIILKWRRLSLFFGIIHLHYKIANLITYYYNKNISITTII